VTTPISSVEARAAFASLARFPRLALAVSGGADSMALLHLMAEWRAEGEPRPGLTVLTVDHGLRAESRDEAAMVMRTTERLGLPHAILTWRQGGKQSGGLQERAREARYDLMAAYCHAHDIPALVTAHHLDDQAETFLMRLKRGSGLDGLAAIPEESVWSGIAVLRPLLDLPKARLAATLAAAGLGWAEDPSNRDERFERARVRASHEALAKLGLTPEAIARSARRLTRARAALDDAAREFLTTHGAMSEAGYCVIERAALIAVPEEIALRVLARAVNAVSGREAPLRLAKLESLLEGLSKNPKSAHTLGGCRLQPIGGRLGVFRETRGTGLPSLQLAPGERALWDNRFAVELRSTASAPVTVAALGEARWRDLRALAPWLDQLPRFAGAALPACFDGDQILVPNLCHGADAAGGGGVEFSARFVNAPSTFRQRAAFEGWN
jgi:tRNA(Ile)-lysidine synthase